MKYFLSALAFTLFLTGCGSSPVTEEFKKDAPNEATAKLDNNLTPTTSITPSPSPTSVAQPEPSKENPLYVYFDATWSEDFKGLKSEITTIAATDKAESNDGSKFSVIGVKFKIENTTKDVFTTFPDQAVLVTSTGEQIDNTDLFSTEHIGGEIEEGVIKEGRVYWVLKRGHAEDVKWIKLKWTSYYKDDIMDNHEYVVKLELKKK